MNDTLRSCFVGRLSSTFAKTKVEGELLLSKGEKKSFATKGGKIDSSTALGMTELPNVTKVRPFQIKNKIGLKFLILKS